MGGEKEEDCNEFFKQCENLSSVGLLSHADLTKDEAGSNIFINHSSFLPPKWRESPHTHARVEESRSLTLDLSAGAASDLAPRITGVGSLIIKPEQRLLELLCSSEETHHRSALGAP